MAYALLSWSNLPVQEVFLTGERAERRLAAVLAADVAGYSRLMGRDEEGTLANLKSLRKTLVDPAIAAHRGRIVKTTGDGMLVEFASAVDAARCAVVVQRGVAAQNGGIPQDTRIEFRIGIHVGDIIIDDNDIFGDGVNIAARLEGIAEPGGVCISDDAQRQIRGKVDIDFDDMGSQTLKNITEPMRAWRVRLDGSAPASPQVKPSADMSQPLALPDKPSIAVLPFQNMSGDPEQEYFADGMVEEIITALSRFRSLFVIARNSSFAYKGKAVDIKQVGRELGVRYLLEGSVRKAGGKVRITGQLIDTATGAHLWADRFDGSLEDVFDLQDRVTTSVVGLIAPKLEQAEIERAKRKPTEKLDAYDYYLRGLSKMYQWSKPASEEALRLFASAVDLDPEFATAYAVAARCVGIRRQNAWLAHPEREVAEGLQWARRALELGKDDALVLSQAGFAVGYLGNDVEGGSSFLDRSLSLNSNSAVTWILSAWIQLFLGNPDEVVARASRALRLSPVDPIQAQFMTAIALGHFLAGRFEDSLLWTERALLEQPNLLLPLLCLVGTTALLGRIDEAQRLVPRLLQVNPSFRISDIKDMGPFRRPEDPARFAEGARLAGLPE
jgi:TolB-like protein/class 3 adenylate cyclase